MKFFDVIITETLEKIVRMEAENEVEAVRQVHKAYDNGEFVLDSENFTGVEFSAKPAETIKVANIKWDTDDDEEILKTLPTEVEIPLNEINQTADPEDAIADWLSDEYGYCIFGFDIEG